MALCVAFTAACGAGVLEIDEVHRITNAYAVAFLQRYLNNDLRYARFLTRSYARRVEPDVDFFSKPRPRPRRPLWWRSIAALLIHGPWRG